MNIFAFGNFLTAFNMKTIVLLFIFLISSGLNFVFSQQKIETKKVPSTLSKHGITIQDDYAWLENTTEKEVADWVTLQNNISEEKLSELVRNYNFSFKI